MKYDYNTFKELFDSHINYAYEPQYGCRLDNEDGQFHMWYAEFYKLTIYENGTLDYKGNTETYNPILWPKVKLLVEMLQETKAEKILLKNKKGSEHHTEE